MPHYTTFDVNTAVQPAQVMTVPRASEPVPPKSSTAPQATPIGSPLIINLPGPVQFRTGEIFGNHAGKPATAPQLQDQYQQQPQNPVITPPPPPEAPLPPPPTE